MDFMVSTDLRIVTSAQADELLRQAQISDRRRTHMLLHESHSDQVQRLLVAFSKGTYIQPHCHPEQWEMIIPLRGALEAFIFSTDGTVLERKELVPHKTSVAHIPAGTWHTIVAVTSTALMLEAKPGPYRPATFAIWAPAETDKEAEDYLKSLSKKLSYSIQSSTC